MRYPLILVHIHSHKFSGTNNWHNNLSRCFRFRTWFASFSIFGFGQEFSFCSITSFYECNAFYFLVNFQIIFPWVNCYQQKELVLIVLLKCHQSPSLMFLRQRNWKLVFSPLRVFSCRCLLSCSFSSDVSRCWSSFNHSSGKIRAHKNPPKSGWHFNTKITASPPR